MPHDHLGLFDTPPNRGENRLAVAVVGVLLAAFLALLPVSRAPVGPVAAFIPMVGAVLFVGDLIIGALLYAQAQVFRSRALTLLAASFVFAGLILIPYTLTFPGAFAPGGLLHAGLNTAAWLMMIRQCVVPLAILVYALLKQADLERSAEAERGPPRMLAGIAAAVGLTIALTLLTTVGGGSLPPMFTSQGETIPSQVHLLNLIMLILLATAFGTLLRRRTSVLDTWLLASLAMMFIHASFNLANGARFTLGWYCMFLLIVFSHLFVLLALIAEFNRLYVRLALATAARGREQDARLMSMDGVAAAISHEIGQPLAAVSLSAGAALNALARPQPETERAIKSLRGAIDANQRAFAVLESIRAMFDRKSSSLTTFDLNALVRESAALLDRELAAQRIVLRIALDDTLPPILANRVQLQRVLVNLLSNAIEAIDAAKPRERRIGLSSMLVDDETLRVEISDTGAGVTPESLTRIFEPFFTTKSSGTGLGLSLSRLIIEHHGGRLWASPAEDGGAVFFLELRRAPDTAG